MERRQISYPRLLWRMGAAWVLFPLLFAATFGGIGYASLTEWRLLERYGVESTATVTGKSTRIRRDSDGRRQTDYLVSYAFTPEGGASISDRTTVRARFYNSVNNGDTIPVRYVPHRPEVHEIEPGSNRIFAVVFGGIGVLAALSTVGLGWWMWQRKRSVVRAARHGEVRQARVTGTRRTNTTKNNRPMHVLQWRDAAGETGESRMRRAEALAAWPVGSVIVIYVDPLTGTGWWDEDF